MYSRPIAEYALLSDRHGAALVSRDGSIDWLCSPRFDSPAVFARLLDEAAGHWSIHPEEPATVSREYLDGTMVLHTTFRVAGGTVRLIDALAVGDSGDPHRLGAGAPHLLAREVTCLGGGVNVAVEFRPRPEYGLIEPLLSPVDGGVEVRGGPAASRLSSPIELTIRDGEAGGVARMRPGQTLRFALHLGSLAGPAPRTWDQGAIGEQIMRSVAAWRAWSQTHQNYDGPWRDLVRHSGRVLQALSYQPTGAIVAAATTSLPEQVGGPRNWDYRYTWVRDAALAMDALWVAACPDEAAEFFSFMNAAAATSRPDRRLQIVYGVGGEHDLTERELPHLRGWRGSRPVRVGNAAHAQTQLDVYGELLVTAARFADQLDAADPALTGFLSGLADAAAVAWPDPDHGIWEIRGELRHFLHSKLMCWAALDRAVALAGRLGCGDRREHWGKVRDVVAAVIYERGFDPAVGTFTQAFGSKDLDASALLIPIVGFLPADDPRVLATIDAVADRLTDPGGLVYRYRPGSDGLPGDEGVFLLCTFWLAHAYALAGRVSEAREVFERAIRYVNDVGLLAEQADPATGELLGNFPQAFSHVGLVNAAYAIAEAEQSQA